MTFGLGRNFQRLREFFGSRYPLAGKYSDAHRTFSSLELLTEVEKAFVTQISMCLADARLFLLMI